MSAEEETEKLAEAIAKEAIKSKALGEKIDALKVLTGYYTALNRNKPKGEEAEPPDDGASFKEFKREMDGFAQDDKPPRKM